MTRKEAAELRREVQELRDEVARLRCELASRASAPQYVPYPVPYQPPLPWWQNPVIAGAAANVCAGAFPVTIYGTTGAAQPFKVHVDPMPGCAPGAESVSVIPFSGGTP